METINSKRILSARISPKEISGANGKFLPKPLLFHLRLPNSKTNELKFCQILSPENSFGKTETNLFLNFVRPQKGVWGGIRADFWIFWRALTYRQAQVITPP